MASINPGVPGSKEKLRERKKTIETSNRIFEKEGFIMPIVGLYGDSRSGKDTTARIMQEMGFEWRSFAAPLRQILYNIDPLIHNVDGDVLGQLQHHVDSFGWDWVKKYAPVVVDQMISLGQSVRDLIHEDAWIWGVIHDPLPKYMVISDVRQPNEYDAIINAGGEVWRIIRAGTTRRAMDGLLDDRYFHCDLYNNGSEDDFRLIVRSNVEYAIQNRWT
jgi:hypothetical protein